MAEKRIEKFAMSVGQVEQFADALNRNYGPPFLPEDIVKASVTDDGFCLTIGPRDVDFNNKLEVLGAGTCLFAVPDMLTNDPDELKRVVKFYRAFARQVRDLVADDEAKFNQRIQAIKELMKTYENQWPNWLDEPGN